MRNKVLVIDDELIVRKNLAKLLSLDGYEVFTAESGQQGLDIFEKAKGETPGPIEVVISDIKMPGIDGIEVLQRIKERTPGAEVIMVTGHGAIDSAILALRSGAFDYITKPIEYDELALAISRALERQRLITERQQAEEQLKASLEEKEVLLKEVHHRVKNNLQLLSSMFHLQSGLIKNKAAQVILKDIQNCVRSLALIHEKLYRSENLTGVSWGKYLRELVADLSISYGRASDVVTMKVTAEDILLDMDAAIPCSLIVNELVSNALKYAFPEGKKGEICVDFRSGNHELTLIVNDNGVGFPKDLDFLNAPSLGLQLVMSLVNQLDGTIEMDSSAGTAFKIMFPQTRHTRWRG